MEEILSYGIKYTEMGFVLTFVYAFFLYVMARVTLRLINRFTNRIIEQKGKSAVTLVRFLQSLAKVAIYALFVYLVLVQFRVFSTLGNVLLGTSSVFGVAIALASQESMSNFVGGFFLSMYQPIRVNDYVTIQDKNIAGRVKEIGFRQTTIITINNTEITVPNSIMNSSVIENMDICGPYKNLLVFSIGYSCSMDDAIKIITENTIKHPLVIDTRTEDEKAQGHHVAPTHVINLGNYSVDIRVSFFTKDFADGFSTSCDLRKSVKEEFDKLGIVIPFPTQTIITEKDA